MQPIDYLRTKEFRDYAAFLMAEVYKVSPTPNPWPADYLPHYQLDICTDYPTQGNLSYALAKKISLKPGAGHHHVVKPQSDRAFVNMDAFFFQSTPRRPVFERSLIATAERQAVLGAETIVIETYQPNPKKFATDNIVVYQANRQACDPRTAPLFHTEDKEKGIVIDFKNAETGEPMTMKARAHLLDLNERMLRETVGPLFTEAKHYQDTLWDIFSKLKLKQAKKHIKTYVPNLGAS